MQGEKGRRELQVNFLSTTGDAAYGHPYYTAKKLNAKLMSDDSPELSGWVIVDFGTAEIAEKIYGYNFK